MIMGDELGMRFETESRALIVGQAKEDGVQFPVMAEVDDAAVEVRPLGESGGVDHDAAETGFAECLCSTGRTCESDARGHAAEFQEVASAHGEIMAGQSGFSPIGAAINRNDPT